MDKTPRILITRLSHIGDCILTLPMLSAIRRQYPDSYIGWAVESPTQQLLSLVPGLDEIIPVPKGWIKKPSNWKSLRNKLRERRFDIAIDPQGITKSAALGWISGAKTRIGVRGSWGRELSPYLNNRLVTTTRDHLVDRSLELLEALDINEPTVNFQLPVDEAADKLMRQFIELVKLGKKFVMINPGASWLSKRWDNVRLAKVASYIWSYHGLKSVITWAGDEELKMASDIKLLSPNSVELAPKTNLRELAALSSRAEFFIGCDTGPMHIAAAMNTRCIGLYGPTRPCDSGAYGPGHIHLQKRYHSGTSRQRRSANNEAMLEILVSDVCQAVDRMLIDTKSMQPISRAA